MTIPEYIKRIDQRYKTGISREHSYRGDLQTLLESLLQNVLVTNEPARIDCGAPDFILTKKDIPVGYIEAKDIGEPLSGTRHKEQFTRYRESLPNIIFTDYLDFHFYRDSEFVTSVRIGEIAGDSIRFVPENEARFSEMILVFATHSLQVIRSASKLSRMMAAKARLLSEIIENALDADAGVSNQVNDAANNTLHEQLSAFQNVLIHDISTKEFADIYAQTIAYGMFAARLHDHDLETFSRQEAARLIPKSNPFLRKLFQYIAGYDLDERIDWIVDALADIFRATDVSALLTDFGKSTQKTDPIIHFYETFLAEFDPKLRKSRGVWYTPEPVVNFIVRAVDDILKEEFGLKDGLADTSKVKVKVKVPTHDKRYKQGIVEEEREVHKVQILDPAAGTGTFLAEVIKQIHKKFEGQQGIWPDYVENHLIPRLNGFEILMASYAMAHLKLDLLLKETGYDRETNQRFRIYLTNSLEEHHPDTGTLFAGWLSSEANEANHIKRDTPVMVVMGNPPYSGESQNKGEWIMKLMEDYKKEPGGKEKLKERNPKWINDDYVKFLRFGQYFIEENGEGIVAYINPHGFLDNPTFRGMRWNLLRTFDKIYTIDLHGNSKKKEITANGSPDENVFDIQQGVSINLMIKNGRNKKGELGELFHYDIYGLREEKYSFLLKNAITTIDYIKLNNSEPMYFFNQKDFKTEKIYKNGFDVSEVFITNSAGVVTARDSLTIHFSLEELKSTVDQFVELETEAARKLFDLGKDTRDWKIALAQEDIIRLNNYHSSISKVLYRPFDLRWSVYTGKTKGFHCMPRAEVMNNLFNKMGNVALILPRQTPENESAGVNICNTIACHKTFSAYNLNYIFPLYVYSKTDQQTLDGTSFRKPNINPKIVKMIEDRLDLRFVFEKNEEKSNQDLNNGINRTFAPIDLLDYIYAMLHSPTYIEVYKEFLKIDFPRVPYPEDPVLFWKLAKLGGKLRQIHLMEHPVVNEFITIYPKAGSNEITRRISKNDPGFVPEKDNKEIGKVWINNEQYFGNVPLKAWEFYIGGYQPAQKWLKDRHDRSLSMEEIQHYQKIIVALVETQLLMNKIDETYAFDQLQLNSDN